MPDRYQEIAPIGKYRNIWLVLDRDTGKIYVRKCLETFNLEVYERVAGLHNVHIPGIAAWKLEDDRLWLIEEYVNGETLEECLAGGRAFSREEAVGIIRQVCEALACLHSQEPPVIHRDVKLSNIMISHDGIVKLIDYNAARLYEKGLNQDTRLIGTEAYAAPEQFGFAQTDARTDIYALGVVFNYLMTGEHVNRRTADGACGAIVKKCTQMDPDRRYQSVRELDKALQAVCPRGPDSAGAQTVCPKGPDSAGVYAEATDSLWERTAPWKEEESGKNSGIGSIWPIPGFRSGIWWKKILAVTGYLSIFCFCVTLEFESDVGRPLDLWTDRLITLASMLFTVAVYTNYHGVAAKMPLLKNKKRWVRWAGYCMVWPLALVVLLLLREVAVSLIQVLAQAVINI